MNDDRANKYVDLYLPHVLDDSSTECQKRRILFLLVKEVERDTRHQAAKEVQNCINRVHNLEYDNDPR